MNRGMNMSEMKTQLLKTAAKRLFAAFLLLTAIHVSAQPIPVSTDTDNDGLRDVDEVSVVIDVPAGPSDDFILSVTTGLTLEGGDSLLIRATGTVRADVSQGPSSGPNGLSTGPAFPPVQPDAPFLSLIGRIGSGEWFFVGSELLLDATEAGEIRLAVNEVPGSYANNSGSFTVELGRGLGTRPDDPDTDGDGVQDGDDGAPLDPLDTVDTDGDGVGNRVDPDDDNDGLFDSEEIGGTLVLPATGTPLQIPVYQFSDQGLFLQPAELPIFSATGIIADPAIDATSTPNGRSDLNTNGLVLTLPGAPLYSLLGRFAHGEWVRLGEAFQFGYASPVEITDRTYHLGDNTVSDWEVPLADGVFLDLPFTLDGPVLGAAVLRLEVWSTLEDNRVFLNGRFAGRLCANRNSSWTACEIPLASGLFRSGQNLIRIVAGNEQNPVEQLSTIDDFQIRAATIDFVPSHYRVIDLGTYHLGDAVIQAFEIPAPDGTSHAVNFHLTHFPASATGTLSIDAYEVTSNRPPNRVFLNDVEIGALCQRPPEENDFWDHCEIIFDVSLLKVGTNTLRVESAQGGQFNDYDDFMIRMISMKLPFVGDGTEMLFSYNERIGQYFDNTGAYSVTIGSGTTTDPLKADTDDDGIDDKTELDLDLDPNDPADALEDPDLDGLSTLAELDLETDPFKPDTDGDRIGDGVEVGVGTDPTDDEDPLEFDFNLDGELTLTDLLHQIGMWYSEVVEFSFEKIGDADDSGRIDAEDVLRYKEAVAD